MNGEVIYNIGQLHGVKDFAVDAALENYGSRAALFTSLLELSTLSGRLFSEFSPGGHPLELKRAAMIVDGIRERLEKLAAPSLAAKATALLDALAAGDGAATTRKAWSSLHAALEKFNLMVAAARRRREPVRRERFEQFLEAMAGSADSQTVLSHLRELRSSYYSTKIEAILERIEQLLSQDQRATARKESSQLLESVIREENGGMAEDDGEETEEMRFDPGPPKKIMIIDDVPVVLLTVKSLLVPRYQVIAVKDYKAAIKALGATTVDLILVDINMPGMNGITLVKVIRAMRGYEKTPILFLTGNSDRESVLGAIGAGGNDFILKPVNREVLIPKIEKFLSTEQRPSNHF